MFGKTLRKNDDVTTETATNIAGQCYKPGRVNRTVSQHCRIDDLHRAMYLYKYDLCSVVYLDNQELLQVSVTIHCN